MTGGLAFGGVKAQLNLGMVVKVMEIDCLF